MIQTSSARFQASRHMAALLVCLCLVVSLAHPTRAAGTAPPPFAPPPFAPQGRPYTLYKTPFPAPLTELRDGANLPLSLERYRGKIVLLNFWATWCAPCVREMPDLNRLQHALGPNGLAVVTVSLNRDPEAARQFFKMLRLDALPLAFDVNEAAYKAFRAQALPTSYVIDRTGIVRGYFEGPAPWDSPGAKALLQWYLDRKE